MERERRVSNAGDCLDGLGARVTTPEEGVGQPDNREQGFSLSTPPFSCFLQEAQLLPQLGDHPRLQDLPLLRVPPHPLVSPPRGSRLGGMEQGEAHPLRPLSPQHKAPVVEGLGPPAWPQPLPEPNSGKSAR